MYVASKMITVKANYSISKEEDKLYNSNYYIKMTICDVLLFLFKYSSSIPGEGNGNPLQYSCLENPMDRGAW